MASFLFVSFYLLFLMKDFLPEIAEELNTSLAFSHPLVPEASLQLSELLKEYKCSCLHWPTHCYSPKPLKKLKDQILKEKPGSAGRFILGSGIDSTEENQDVQMDTQYLLSRTH